MRMFCLLLLLAPVAGNAQPADDWVTYLATYPKGTGSVQTNLALLPKAPVDGYRYLVSTGVRIKECPPGGLPTSRELNTLYTIANGLAQLLEKKKRTISAGSLTYQCQRIEYFYVNDTTLLRRYLTEFYTRSYPHYSYIIRLEEDRDWKHYRSFLYPKPEIMESMKNQQVLLQLTQAGDKLTKERRIDHTLLFPS